MGILKHVLFWPVTGPVAGVRWTLEKVQRVVEDELADDSSIKQDLMELNMRSELGEIDDAEYLAEEAKLMDRLRAVREWRERLGRPTAGGPVRVARDDPDSE